MTVQKDLKRLVRARMRKTGEAYTTARTQTLKQKPSRAPSLPDLPARYPELAGMSDDAVRTKTGKPWPDWTKVLDRAGAVEMRHADIVRHLHEVHGLGSWWAQMVTVGYERIRGLRDVGQRRGGGYEVNKSRTLGVPLPRLYRAFSVRRTRARWLPEIEPVIRTATVNRSMRITWPDGTDVHVMFYEKAAARSQVTIQHGKLANKAASERVKAWWSERLGALEALFERR